jgi:hypothetical protein
MRIGLYKVFYYSPDLMDALRKGFPEYFGPASKWSFTYKQPSNNWRDSVDTDEDGDIVVEKVKEDFAALKVSARTKKGAPTSTTVGTLAKK